LLDANWVRIRVGVDEPSVASPAFGTGVAVAAEAVPSVVHTPEDSLTWNFEQILLATAICVDHSVYMRGNKLNIFALLVLDEPAVEFELIIFFRMKDRRE
jgi:hypothetical protein